MTSKDDYYGRFFAGLVASIPQNLPDPRPRHCYQLPTGIPGVHFEWIFRARTFGVELHFERGDRDANLSMMESLRPLGPEVARAVGQAPVFDDAYRRQWAKIVLETPRDRPEEELAAWAVDTMVALYRLVGTRLAEWA